MSETTIGAQWFSEYFDRYRKPLFESGVEGDLLALRNRVAECSDSGGKIVIVGNGGSAAIADHCAVDLSKNAGIRAISFAGAAWVSCLSNDFGYEEWVSRSLSMHADPRDVVVLISSSGASENMLRAAKTAKQLGMYVITLSGFAADNPLRRLGDLNLWVDSRAYNIVEMTHHIWLLAVIDALIGTAEYSSAGKGA